MFHIRGEQCFLAAFFCLLIWGRKESLAVREENETHQKGDCQASANNTLFMWKQRLFLNIPVVEGLFTNYCREWVT